jgi:hypothetical protein
MLKTVTIEAAAPSTTKPLPAGIVKMSKTYNVDPTTIVRRPGWNARFDFGDTSSLASSIYTECQRDPSSGGLLNPLRVKRLSKDDPLRADNATAEFALIDGDRRLTAIESLLKANPNQFPEGVRVTLVDRDQDDLNSLVQMYTANTGKPLLPLEEAAAFKRMQDSGLTIAGICNAVGRSDVHVRETLALLTSTAEVVDAIVTGKVSGSMAKNVVVAAKGDKVAEATLLAAAVAVKAAKGAVAKKQAKAALTAQVQAQKDANTLAAGKEVKVRTMTTEQIEATIAKLVAHMKSATAEGGIDVGAEPAAMRAFIEKDATYAAIYTFGAIQALQVARGEKINLEL